RESKPAPEVHERLPRRAEQPCDRVREQGARTLDRRAGNGCSKVCRGRDGLTDARVAYLALDLIQVAGPVPRRSASAWAGAEERAITPEQVAGVRLVRNAPEQNHCAPASTGAPASAPGQRTPLRFAASRCPIRFRMTGIR